VRRMHITAYLMRIRVSASLVLAKILANILRRIKRVHCERYDISGNQPKTRPSVCGGLGRPAELVFLSSALRRYLASIHIDRAPR
jgi:hypothetical protein